MEKKYEIYQEKPELLEKRFENQSRILYPMDTIQISTRWGENGTNPIAGRKGFISEIRQGFQSGFDRDYLIAHMMGDEEFGNERDFEMWLYTLDLVEKDRVSGIHESVLKQFGCLLYVDDRIQVVNNSRFNGKIGRIRELRGIGSEGGWLRLSITNDEVMQEMKELYRGLDRKIQEEILREDTSEKYSKVCLKVLETDSEFYESLVKEGKLQEVYQEVLERQIRKRNISNPEFQKNIEDLREKSEFFVSSKNVELVERYPPNDLFIK